MSCTDEAISSFPPLDGRICGIRSARRPVRSSVGMVCAQIPDTFISAPQCRFAGESVPKRVSRVLLTRVVYVLWVAPAIDHRWQRTNQVPAVPKHEQRNVAVTFKREPLVY